MFLSEPLLPVLFLLVEIYVPLCSCFWMGNIYLVSKSYMLIKYISPIMEGTSSFLLKSNVYGTFGSLSFTLTVFIAIYWRLHLVPSYVFVVWFGDLLVLSLLLPRLKLYKLVHSVGYSFKQVHFCYLIDAYFICVLTEFISHHILDESKRYGYHYFSNYYVWIG